MDKTNLEKLISEGLTMPQIGKILNKSVSSVSRLLKKYGLKTKRHIDCDHSALFKICRYCNEKKSIEKFAKAGTIKGVDYTRNKCNTCYVKMKSDRRRRIAAWIQQQKRECSCKCCGNDDFRVLEFHHKDNNKEFDISNFGGSGITKIKKEMKKCDILCANCHRIVTYEERQKDAS